MRYTLVAAGAALALACCTERAPPASAPPPPPAPQAHFPDLGQTPYRATAAMIRPGGESVPLVILRDGDKTRIEVPSPEGEVVRVTDGTGATTLWRRELGRTVLLDPAVEDPSEPADYAFPDFWWEQEGVEANLRQAGPCSLLRQRGNEWSLDDDGGARSVCVTPDGLVLWATERGATVWRLTSLQRGPQDAAEFTTPDRARPPPREPPPEERDLNAAYVPPPQFPSRSDMLPPQNR